MFLTRDLAQFKFEDRSRLGDVNSVFVDYLKDWEVVIDQLDDVHLGLAYIFVKAPFVDLVPIKISHLFGFFTKISCNFSVMLLK